MQRQNDGMLDPFPIWDDIRTFDAAAWCGRVDVITAGFPCQPFSVAGQQARENDERNMWPDTLRCIREVGPRYCLLENVPGLVRCDYFGQILGDLADAGYDAEWDIISAEDVGAPHRRRRLWILAYTDEPGLERRHESAVPVKRLREEVANAQGKRIQESGDVDSQAGKGNGPRAFNGSGEDVPDSQREVLDSNRMPREEQWEAGRVGRERKQVPRHRGGPWPVEPDVGRVAHGVASRVDRLKAIGNGQVPAVVRVAWNLLT